MIDKICKTCFYRLSDFKRTGYLGCPDCYKYFEEEINRTLPNIQSGYFHNGKIPKISGVDKELLSEYKRLLVNKETAGIEGRFEDMAIYNKQILELTTELKRRGLI